MKSVKLLLIFSFILCACNEEYELDDIVINNNVDTPTTVILQERDPSFPLILSKTKTKSRDGMLTRAALSHEEYLGRSFHLEKYPYDDEMNLGYAVVDFSKADEKGYITSHGASRSFMNYFTFSDYDHYLEKSKITNTVTSGFKINLGIFSFGHKKTMTEVFESSLLMNDTQVAGEADIYVQSNLHELQYSSNIRRNIILYYLDDIFKDEIYNNHTSEFYKNYGGFVLKKFITGGRATALYYGEVNESYAFESTEKIMDESINAGIKYKGKPNKDSLDLSADLEFGMNNNDGNSKEYSKKFTSLNYSVQTVGGVPIYPAFSTPKDLFEFKIDLSGWLSSLSDPSTHALIRISDEGLVPISDFVLEENVADRINFCIEGTGLRELCEPEICIYHPEYEGAISPWRKYVAVYLHTRNNEYVILEYEEYDSDIYRLLLENFCQKKYSNILKTRIISIGKRPDNGFYHNYSQGNGSFVSMYNPLIEIGNPIMPPIGNDSIIPSIGNYPIIKDKIIDSVNVADIINIIKGLNATDNPSETGDFIPIVVDKLPLNLGYDYIGAKIEDCKVYKAADGTIYLLDTEKKKGYSIYSDYLLDTYAIRDYVNTLPTIDIAPELLFDYKILAL